MRKKVLVFFGIGAFGLLLFQIMTLFFMGQPIICTCDTVKIWVSEVLSSDNSQHLFDWYTFSHIIHGFLFYMLAWIAFPRMSVWGRLLVAISVEVAWEVIENTPWVINHYREQALAQGYTGDSILNSLSDTFAMIAGFIAAHRLPLLVIVATLLLFEVGTALVIRDNLLLNIINLIYPLEFIHTWQSGLAQ